MNFEASLPVVVTGASGFIGRHVCALLRRHERVALAVSREDLKFPTRVLERCRTGCLLLHLAGSSHNRGTPMGVYDANVVPLLAALDAFGPSAWHVVLLSSVSVYGLFPGGDGSDYPDSDYGRSKWLCERALELAAQQFEFTIAIVRSASVYGEGNMSSNAIAALTRAVAAGATFSVRRGAAGRDYVYVRDVAEALVRVLVPESRGPLDLGSGVLSTPQDLVDCARRLGYEVQVAEVIDEHPMVSYTTRLDGWEALGFERRTPVDLGLTRELVWRCRTERRAVT